MHVARTHSWPINWDRTRRLRFLAADSLCELVCIDLHAKDSSSQFVQLTGQGLPKPVSDCWEEGQEPAAKIQNSILHLAALSLQKLTPERPLFPHHTLQVTGSANLLLALLQLVPSILRTQTHRSKSVEQSTFPRFLVAMERLRPQNGLTHVHALVLVLGSQPCYLENSMAWPYSLAGVSARPYSAYVSAALTQLREVPKSFLPTSQVKRPKRRDETYAASLAACHV